MTFEDALKIRERIAVPHEGYPASEAFFADVKEWEDYFAGDDGRPNSWKDYFENVEKGFRKGDVIG